MFRISGNATIALIVLYLRSVPTKIAHVEVCILNKIAHVEV